MQGGRARNRGHKETHGRLRLDLRRSTPGGCHTRLKVPGEKPPEHPALCGHWPLLWGTNYPSYPSGLRACHHVLATTWLHFSKWNNLQLSGCHVHAKPCGLLLPEDTSEIDCTCDLFISTTILPLISLSHPFATPNKDPKLIIMSNSSGKIFWDILWAFFLSDSLSSDRKGKKQ